MRKKLLRSRSGFEKPESREEAIMQNICSDFIPITATTYYFQNAVGGSYQNTVVVYDANKQSLRYAKLSGGNKVSGAIAFQSGDAYIRINCYYKADVDTVMVNIGSTALPYEPYGYKIPVVTRGKNLISKIIKKSNLNPNGLISKAEKYNLGVAKVEPNKTYCFYVDDEEVSVY